MSDQDKEFIRKKAEVIAYQAINKINALRFAPDEVPDVRYPKQATLETVIQILEQSV